MNLKTVFPLILALSGAWGASMAEAHADLQWSLSIGAPWQPTYVQPAPVYVQPAPVYAQPAPVYVRPAPVYYGAPSVYYRPTPVYGRPIPVYGHRYDSRWDRDGDGIQYRHDRHDRQDDRRWDSDRDGVPDRSDRYPGNPWRR